MALSGLQIHFGQRVTFALLPPKVDHLWPCPNCHRNRFICFQNIVFTNLVIHGWMNERTDGELENMCFCLRIWPIGCIISQGSSVQIKIVSFLVQCNMLFEGLSCSLRGYSCMTCCVRIPLRYNTKYWWHREVYLTTIASALVSVLPYGCVKRCILCLQQLKVQMCIEHCVTQRCSLLRDRHLDQVFLTGGKVQLLAVLVYVVV